MKGNLYIINYNRLICNCRETDFQNNKFFISLSLAFSGKNEIMNILDEI